MHSCLVGEGAIATRNGKITPFRGWVNQCGLVANRAIRAEMQSEDAFVRRLRSSFGYAVAVIWIMTMTMGSIAAAIIQIPLQAPAIIAVLDDTSLIWGIAFGVFFGGGDKECG